MQHPSRIGPYDILELLGEGGVGTVYLAQQSEPIRRRVALKVIKLGMETVEILARFELERRSLGMMNHPNISKVFEAGTTREGRPYFAMEYVDGLPLTEHCDRYRLGVRERLELFTVVCRAVQHAHQRGIIHRDLKPSNVMVTMQDDKPVPIVIDFGLAKAIHEDLTDATLLTRQGQLLGTPRYMSPEQMELPPDEIDTRADIYALGVLLFELIVGVPPHERKFTRAGVPELLRSIRDEETPKPSTRFSHLSSEVTEIVEKRATDRGALLRQIRGGLDAITTKALDRDRERRYSTASELGQDIVRYLNDEPILARSPGPAYRARMFVRRNRVTVVVGTVLGVGLIVGSAISARGYLLADKAREQQRTVSRICEFVRTETANAHLWFEEALADDASLDLDRDVYPALRASETFVAAAMNGGPTPFGVVEVLPSRAAASLLRELQKELRSLHDETEERWIHKADAGRTGGLLDQRYDATYERIQALTANVMSIIEEKASEEWKRSARSGIITNFFALLLLLIAAFAALRTWKVTERT